MDDPFQRQLRLDAVSSSSTGPIVTSGSASTPSSHSTVDHYCRRQQQQQQEQQRSQTLSRFRDYQTRNNGRGGKRIPNGTEKSGTTTSSNFEPSASNGSSSKTPRRFLPSSSLSLRASTITTTTTTTTTTASPLPSYYRSASFASPPSSTTSSKRPLSLRSQSLYGDPTQLLNQLEDCEIVDRDNDDFHSIGQSSDSFRSRNRHSSLNNDNNCSSSNNSNSDLINRLLAMDDDGLDDSRSSQHQHQHEHHRHPQRYQQEVRGQQSAYQTRQLSSGWVTDGIGSSERTNELRNYPDTAQQQDYGGRESNSNFSRSRGQGPLYANAGIDNENLQSSDSNFNSNRMSCSDPFQVVTPEEKEQEQTKEEVYNDLGKCADDHISRHSNSSRHRTEQFDDASVAHSYSRHESSDTRTLNSYEEQRKRQEEEDMALARALQQEEEKLAESATTTSFTPSSSIRNDTTTNGRNGEMLTDEDERARLVQMLLDVATRQAERQRNQKIEEEERRRKQQAEERQLARVIEYVAPESLDDDSAAFSLVPESLFYEGAGSDDRKDVCAICYDPLSSGGAAVALNVCGHIFHLDCIDEWICESSTHCPKCRKSVKEETHGKSPSGSMTVSFVAQNDVAGISTDDQSRAIKIEYVIPDGFQREYHDKPGERYRGCTKIAFLPYSFEGRQLLQRLEYAFSHGFTFCIAPDPNSSGEKDIVDWGTIPHTRIPFTEKNEEQYVYYVSCHEALDRLDVPR
eukprot:CAMPEP_0113484328 /NCGR_PEP_ID=MMETSP0014_2-20120614/23903_1 /TAXON_ID=2857 /ORGANISM="Nitzschia sp." /LENGTH=740 /DNA_ID=CAMNT_0000377923 /DNA_START=275 /DNA_END=2497 /DNA_ORIENTATION=- /assembly_acc=CAM_ASM_000159